MKLEKLFIASVYAPSPWNKEWYALQRKFIFQNTTHIDVQFGVLLNGVEASDLGLDVNVIGDMGSNTGHSAGMAELVRIFRASDCTHFLFLDSDCFPVHAEWFSVLCSQMQQFNKRFSAPIRTENLDRFPHPCAFFCTAESIKDERINFDVGHACANILGETVRDVGNAMFDLLPEILPLMRTNLINRHPVAAGVYHHLFYHHGAGSRNFEFRVMDKYKYYKHWWLKEHDDALSEDLRNELFSNPDKFIRSLM